MTTRRLLLVGTELRFISEAAEGARIGLPGASITALSSLDEALRGEHADGPALLVLHDPSDADVARASQALDPAGLPRWAVVLCRASSPDPAVEAIAPGDWHAPLVGRVFRFAAALHLLSRENAAFRGDLLTLGLRVAHDLRTPLGCISVSTEALKDALAKDSPADLALMKPIVESTDELAGLIRQVSLLAKATARPVPQLHVDAGAAVWASLERLRPAIEARGATVSEPASWPIVVGDSVSLEAIWWNLLSNALRHSGPKPRIELGWERGNEEYRFWVRDHGRGVPPRYVGMLFQPFHRMHEPNAMRGLGLAIVQRLVQLQGGRCGYEAQGSGGSLFYFTLPMGSDAVRVKRA